MQKKLIHRRKQVQIVKNYICGECVKKYGTNAALYTHIKTKHKGVQPEGTTRPEIQGIRGKKGRPITIKQQYPTTPLILLLKQQNYIKFIYEIGQLGQCEDNNFFIRLPEEQTNKFNQQLIQESKQHLKQFQNIPKLNIRYIQAASVYLKQKSIQQIYQLLLLIKIYKGNPILTLDYIEKKPALFPITNIIVANKKQIIHLYELCNLYEYF